MHYYQNCINENIRLLCSNKVKDRLQAEEEDENRVLDEIKQGYTVKGLVGKPFGNEKLASLSSTADQKTVPIWSPLNVTLKFEYLMRLQHIRGTK